MSFLRYPQTQNERRANAGAAHFVRGARTWHNIPSAWDDFIRRSQRSWKAHRKEQHRIKEAA